MKKLLSTVLIIAMTLSLIPATIFAADTDVPTAAINLISPASDTTIDEGKSITVKGTSAFSDLFVTITKSDNTIYFAQDFKDYDAFYAGVTVNFPTGTAGTYTLTVGRKSGGTGAEKSLTITVREPYVPTPAPSGSRRPTTTTKTPSTITFPVSTGAPGQIILRDYAFGQGLFTGGRINSDGRVTRTLLPITGDAGLTAGQRNAVSGKTAYVPNVRLDNAVRNNNLYGYIPAKGIIPNVTVPSGKNPIKMVVYDVATDGATIPYKKSRMADSNTIEFTTRSFGNCVVVGYNDVTFNDLEAVGWATDYIYGLAARDIVEGVDAHLYDPTRAVKRSEFAKMLMFAFDLYKEGDRAQPFSDVPADAWYADVVAAAAELGIVEGREDGTFDGENTITRQEMAAMAVRAFENLPRTIPGDEDIALPAIAGAPEFTDQADIADWSVESIQRLQKANILVGRDSGDFDPRANSSRAEAAKVVWGLFDLTY